MLVMQHPDYCNFQIQDDWWAWAQKCRAPEKQLLREITVAPPPPRSLLARVKRRVKHLLKPAG